MSIEHHSNEIESLTDTQILDALVHVSTDERWRNLKDIEVVTLAMTILDVLGTKQENRFLKIWQESDEGREFSANRKEAKRPKPKDPTPKPLNSSYKHIRGAMINELRIDPKAARERIEEERKNGGRETNQ